MESFLYLDRNVPQLNCVKLFCCLEYSSVGPGVFRLRFCSLTKLPQVPSSSVTDWAKHSHKSGLLYKCTALVDPILGYLSRSTTYSSDQRLGQRVRIVRRQELPNLPPVSLPVLPVRAQGSQSAP